MKANVDLTLNRDFMRREPIRTLTDFFKKGGKYPWSRKIDSLGGHRESWLEEPVFTGGKRLRIEKREYVKFATGATCECCGYELSNIRPWERTGYLLCPACDGSLDDRHRTLWGDYIPHAKVYKKKLREVSLEEIQFTIDELVNPDTLRVLNSEQDLLEELF